MDWLKNKDLEGIKKDLVQKYFCHKYTKYRRSKYLMHFYICFQDYIQNWFIKHTIELQKISILCKINNNK